MFTVVALNQKYEKIKRETQIYQEQVQEKNKRIKQLEKENCDFCFEIATLKRQVSELENERFAHGEKEYHRGINEAINRLSYEACQKNDSEAYLKGFKEGIEWLNGVLKK